MVEIREVKEDGKVYCENCGTLHHQEWAVVDGHQEWCVLCAEVNGLIEPEEADRLLPAMDVDF